MFCIIFFYLRKQNELAKKIITSEIEGSLNSDVSLVGGFDISFRKENLDQACAMLVVMDLSTMKVRIFKYKKLNSVFVFK